MKPPANVFHSLSAGRGLTARTSPRSFDAGRRAAAKNPYLRKDYGTSTAVDAASTFAEEVQGSLKMIYGAAAGEASEGALSFDHLDAKAATYGEERGAELVGRRRIDGKLVENPNAEWAVSKTTRDGTNKLLQQAMAEGWSPQKFAQRLEDSGLYGEARAEMIARTEVAIAQNYGQSETYSEMGFSRVYVQDGDCDECREVDGKVASIAWIQNNPTGHPHCTRSCSPAPDDEPIDLE